MKPETLDRALIAASDYRRLVALGHLPLADVAECTIDDLVGYWRDHHTFAWPTAVAEAAGVHTIRRTVGQ